MNYILNHDVVTGQKLPIREKINHFFVGFTDLFLLKTLGFCKILI